LEDFLVRTAVGPLEMVADGENHGAILFVYTHDVYDVAVFN
jgi:hypothetical protein